MRITNILWDTEEDGERIPQEDLGLPSEVEVADPMDTDEIADWLSDTYGYCVLRFEIGRTRMVRIAAKRA